MAVSKKEDKSACGSYKEVEEENDLVLEREGLCENWLQIRCINVGKNYWTDL